MSESKDNGLMRTFDSGAVRDTSIGKLDYEACLSPLVLQRYAEYIRSTRIQPDGNARADDNWQKGFGLSIWMKSKWRHFMSTWIWHRTGKCKKGWDIEKSLCAEIFNTHGMLHEILKEKEAESSNSDSKDFEMWYCKKHNTHGHYRDPCWQCKNEYERSKNSQE